MSQDISFKQIGDMDETKPVFVWGHGWGQSHAAFLPLAESLKALGTHILIDFPGFGDSPAPDTPWDTKDYADHMAAFIRTKTKGKVIWIGHSFGCRVGLQLAANHADILEKMCFIAGAGLKRQRPPLKRLYLFLRVKLFKALKKLIPLGLSKDWLYTKFGSADYKSAGPMRQIFVKVVNEDLVEQALQTACPTLLIYGSKDTETPPELGERLDNLIPNSKLIVINGFDHYSILSEARHQVAQYIHDFIKY